MLTRGVALVGLISLVLLGAGCHGMAFEVAPGRPVSKVVYQRKAFYMWGLAPTRMVRLTDYCPNGVVKVREKTEFSDGLLGILTLGIYSPRSSWYYCAAKGAP